MAANPRNALRRKQQVEDAQKAIPGLQELQGSGDSELAVPMHGFEHAKEEPTLFVRLPSSFPEDPPLLFVDAPVEHAWVDPSSQRVVPPSAKAWNKYTTTLSSVLSHALHGLAGFPIASRPSDSALSPAPQLPAQPSQSSQDVDNREANGPTLSPAEALEHEGNQLIEHMLATIMSEKESMNNAQLESLLSDPELLDNIVAGTLVQKTLPWRQALLHNKSLAEENAELAHTVHNRRSNANVVRSSELNGGVVERIRSLKSRHDSLLERFHPQKLVEATEAASREYAAEAERLRGTLISSGDGLNDYRDARYWYHYYATLAQAGRIEMPNLEDDFYAGR